MASYLEIFALKSDSELQDRTAVAIVKKAQTILDSGNPSKAEVEWAINSLNNPKSEAASMLNYVLAANGDATIEQIQGSSDAALQSNVDAAVDVIISGGA